MFRSVHKTGIMLSYSAWHDKFLNGMIFTYVPSVIHKQYHVSATDWPSNYPKCSGGWGSVPDPEPF